MVSVALLSFCAYAVEPAASQSTGNPPVGPWFDDGGLHDLYGMYPGLRNDTNVTGFIDTYGFKGWFQKVAYEELDYKGKIKLFYRYAFLQPANNDSILMVLLINESLAREEKVSVWTRIINASEEVLPLTAEDMRNLARVETPPDLPDNATDQNAGGTGGQSANATPGFASLVATASILLVILCKKKYR
jgi:hypothetical protein